MGSVSILQKYQHFWLDAPQRAIFGSGLSRSLRQLSQEWAATLGASVGLRTINERINQLEARLAQVHREPISEVPAVVQFDGIWLSMQTPQGGIHEDSRKRKRQRKRGKRIVVLVALGLWTDRSGKRRILDWEVAEKEEQAAWERLVQRLWESWKRACRPLSVMAVRGWSKPWTTSMARPWCSSAASSTSYARSATSAPAWIATGKNPC